MSALELLGVTYRYEASAFRFDLAVAEGEWVAIIGPSGAGKSTLLDIAAGFVEPMAGTVRMGGRDRTRAAPADRPLSVVFQDNNLFSHLDAETNVAIGISPALRLGGAVRAQARDALARVGLAGLERRRPAQMSGGERQRVALARALARERPLLLLDEAFGALGPALREEMLALVARLRGEAPEPFAVVMVTHRPDDARGFADRVAFLDQGEIRLVGPTERMLDEVADPALRAYLGQE